MKHVEAHPEFLQPPALAPHMAHLHGHPHVAAQLDKAIADWQKRVPKPEYTCPTCRIRIYLQPVQIYAFKDVVHKIARLTGDENVGTLNMHQGLWDGFFPAKK